VLSVLSINLGRMAEQTHWTRVALAGGRPLVLMSACFERHRYAPHVHEEFAIGVTTGGLESISYRGATHLSGPGSIVVLEPDEAHTGAPAGPDGFAYRVLYPPAELFGEGVAGRPHFRDPVIDDPALAAALHRAHIEAGTVTDPLEAESRLPWLFTELALRHAVSATARPVRAAPGAGKLAGLIRERLAGQLIAPPSLAELADELGVSRYQLLRAFRESVGMPPYAWLAQHRVARARALLDAGHRPAQAAALVGFADQAHMNRWFRRVMGTTPGAYRTYVQDGGLVPRR
jgi:AraC-like DNA-binding protein